MNECVMRFLAPDNPLLSFCPIKTSKFHHNHNFRSIYSAHSLVIPSMWAIDFSWLFILSVSELLFLLLFFMRHWRFVTTLMFAIKIHRIPHPPNNVHPSYGFKCHSCSGAFQFYCSFKFYTTFSTFHAFAHPRLEYFLFIYNIFELIARRRTLYIFRVKSIKHIKLHGGWWSWRLCVSRSHGLRRIK